MSEKSPYREIGTSAQAALKGKEGRPAEKLSGIRAAIMATRRRGRRARKCRCGQPAMGGSEWCWYCHGAGPRKWGCSSITSQREAARRRRL